MQEDCVITFLDKYSRGEVLAALQAILPAPGIPYDELSAGNRGLLHVIANYVDATVLNDSHTIAMLAHNNLCAHLEKEMPSTLEASRLLQLLSYENTLLSFTVMPRDFFIEKSGLLHPEILSFFKMIREGTPLQDKDIQGVLSSVPVSYRSCLRNQIALWLSWIRFKQNRPEFGALIQTPPPWHLFHYPGTLTPSRLYEGNTPLIFLEPGPIDFSSPLLKFADRPSVFVFETKAALAQMLQFPEVEKALSNPQHVIYILEIYPNSQILAQNAQKRTWESFEPIFFTPRSPIQESLPLFISVLQQCLGQTFDKLLEETSEANWLYAISKRMMFKSRQEQLGKSRDAALLEFTQMMAWHDPHKGLPPPGVQLGPDPHGYFEDTLHQLAARRSPRPLISKPKHRIAHIVPQIVEGGHAPTKLLEILLTRANRSLFDPILISTERMAFHPAEYPYPDRVSPPSYQRSANLIGVFQSRGIPVYQADTQHSYEVTGKMISEILRSQQIDIAIFHSPDVINLFTANMTDVPLRVLVEHGSQAQFPGFDVAIVSSEDALKIYQELFQRLKINAHVIPFATDVRAAWPPLAPTRSSLGLPENAFLMTTISNNLEARLGKEMCLAIAEILKRCPNAYYTPMGYIYSTEKQMKIFTEQGVENRVKFLGTRNNPSYFARAMHMYVNEFPFGSCLGILDAMAAGCPVVTMYDVNGPQQARYGGNFFGIERAITSGKRQDYVELACRLIQDEEVYKEWSEHAVQQYEKYVNVQKYVEDLENILIKAMVGEKGDLV